MANNCEVELIVMQYPLGTRRIYSEGTTLTCQVVPGVKHPNEVARYVGVMDSANLAAVKAAVSDALVVTAAATAVK